MLRDWRRIIDVAARRRALLRLDGALEMRHSSFELLEFDALYNCEESFGVLPPRILDCVTHESAPAKHRLDAAVIALIRADNDADAATSQRVLHSISSIDVDQRRKSIAWLTCEMIYHAGFGDLQIAREAANSLLEQAVSVGQPVAQVLLLRRAAYTCRRTGDSDVARRLCQQSLQTARRLQLHSHFVPTIDLLAQLALDVGDFASATSWLAIAKRIQADSPDFYTRAVAFGLEARYAFETEDAASISDVSRTMLHSESPLRLRRPLQAFLVSKAAIYTLQDDAEPLHSIVDELTSLHRQLSRMGIQDYPVAVLVRALQRLGRDDEASTILSSFLRDERRDQGTPPPALRRLAAHAPMQPQRD